jgi:hypothetical protein
MNWPLISDYDMVDLKDYPYSISNMPTTDENFFTSQQQRK